MTGMWIAEVDTGHFHFLALGNTAEEAREAFDQAFREHYETYGLGTPMTDEQYDEVWPEPAADYFGLWVFEIKPGQCVRDGDLVYDNAASRKEDR